jgi:hypothetical protein
MERKAPDLQDDLWAYIKAGDGVHCPVRADCDTCSLRGECDACNGAGWCLDRNLDFVMRRFEKTTQKYDQEVTPTCRELVFRHPCRIFRLIEFTAECCLQRAGVSYPPVLTDMAIPADMKSDMEVRLVPLNAYHGSLWPSQGKWIVQLNANDSPIRKRFTLFHEIFHIKAHLNTTPVFSKVGSLTGSFNEALADYFAACILAPPHWVEKEWPKFKDARQMAAHFNVPNFVMLVMLKRVGLLV